MLSSVCACVCFLTLVPLCVSFANSEYVQSRTENTLFKRAMKQCTASGDKYSCLAERAAAAMERALDWDIPLFDGVTLARNEEDFHNISTTRAFSGFGRLSSAVSNFLDSHTLVVDLTDDQTDDSVGEARGKEDKKKKKKEKKYASYAMMVLMGIFGLTGPLIMKTLALIAGKALIASKMALLIVGSVALKKLFEKEEKAPSVKVRTVEAKEHDEHDRYYNYNSTPYYGHFA